MTVEILCFDLLPHNFVLANQYKDSIENFENILNFALLPFPISNREFQFSITISSVYSFILKFVTKASNLVYPE